MLTISATPHDPDEWAEFRRVAADHGIGSSLSLPLIANEKSFGAMNLYSTEERAFDDEDRAVGELFATQAAIVLANTHAYWDAHELSVRLNEAMASRAVIEQAKGMLMSAQGIDEDAAFEMLVKASQRENVKLRDIARRIVDNTVARARGEDGHIGETSSLD